MNCIIVDDEEISRNIITHFVEQTDGLNLLKICLDAVEAANFLQNSQVDLILLDIEMPGMSGLELIKSIPSKPAVVIITSKAEHAVEAFEYSVSDYLVKPVSYSRFLKAINKVKRQPVIISAEGNKDLYVKTDSKIIKIILKDLLYVEALADYVILHTTLQKHVVHSTMKGIEKRLSGSEFMRIHRSFIINVEKVESIEDLSVVINNKFIPIGASYKEIFMKRLNIL